MAHNCRIGDSWGSPYECIQIHNELWVTIIESSNIKASAIKPYRVKFCPECGFKIPKRNDYLDLFTIPDSDKNSSIPQFSIDLSTAVAQMNHNVELIKAFMSCQNTQNDCFLERNNEFGKRIRALEEKSETKKESV